MFYFLRHSSDGNTATPGPQLESDALRGLDACVIFLGHR